MTTLTTLWTIVLASTLVGASLSTRRIVLGLHFWRTDTLRQAARIHRQRTGHVLPGDWAPVRPVAV